MEFETFLPHGSALKMQHLEIDEKREMTHFDIMVTLESSSQATLAIINKMTSQIKITEK